MTTWELTAYYGTPAAWEKGKAEEKVEPFDTLDEAYERYRELTNNPPSGLQCVTVEHTTYSDEPLHWERPCISA